MFGIMKTFNKRSCVCLCCLSSSLSPFSKSCRDLGLGLKEIGLLWSLGHLKKAVILKVHGNAYYAIILDALQLFCDKINM